MGKSRKCPPNNDVVWKGYCRRVFLPPRLVRVEDNKTAPSRKKWRPKRSVSEVSGDGGAAGRSPPPSSSGGGRDSRCENTTVMIKNIPNQLRRDFMLKFLDDYCKEHSLEYDFLYLPMDFRKKDNLGYAFVNFTTAVMAMKFKKILQNYKWGLVYDEGRIFTSKKICDITWARIQGKKPLIERFQNSSFACDKLEFLPVVLDPPRNGSDPNPSPPVIIGTLHRQALRKID
ncbi:hypothetical protein DH2020_033891 [Rehmannia glutinosa]|uniref:Mei2-like C-terminal RNA recognition motif domain-containing protein n=1 Tax=Rehmannia glutinosa TaxID=99300 RepID=A0ABR0VEX0_REHGL